MGDTAEGFHASCGQPCLEPCDTMSGCRNFKMNGAYRTGESDIS
jgi:hypothetical protein